MHCLHGVGLDTPDAFSFASTKWYSSQPDVVSGDGDGTVNLRSLTGCQRWIGAQPQNVYYRTFAKAEHLAMLGNDEIKRYIASLLSS